MNDDFFKQMYATNWDNTTMEQNNLYNDKISDIVSKIRKDASTSYTPRRKTAALRDTTIKSIKFAFVQ